MHTNDVQILIADLQPNLIGGSVTVDPATLSLSAKTLAKLATILGLPLTFSVTSPRPEQAKMIPELGSFATAENTFWRGPADPFTDPATKAALEANRRKTLVIAGFASEVVVLHAALSARSLGYDVQLPLDAIGSLSLRTETAAIRQMERAGAIATSIWSLFSLLEPDFLSPPGSDAFAAMIALPPASA